MAWDGYAQPMGAAEKRTTDLYVVIDDALATMQTAKRCTDPPAWYCKLRASVARVAFEWPLTLVYLLVGVCAVLALG